jgi:hypothetical protein
MTAQRFIFQLHCAQDAEGLVLNVGCKEDPAHLKESLGEKVVNLDRYEYNEDTFKHNGVYEAIPVDVVHDIFVLPWPFKKDKFSLVILGDILEDLPDNGCQLDVLREARRVGKTLCITCPEDGPERDDHHQTRITEERLRDWLALTGWDPISLTVVDYTFVPRGYFVFAARVSSKREFLPNR